MDLLKRNLAPITTEAWSAIDEAARDVLETRLGGRKLVDFDGPHGWQHAAVNLGRVELLDEELEGGVHAGLRAVQPLAEVRTPFELELMELDSVARGAEAPDLTPLERAAERIARVENRAIFHGSSPLGIVGIADGSEHDPINWPEEPEGALQAVIDAGERLGEAGVGGPYALALGPSTWQALARATEGGYPIRRRVDELIEGPVVWVPDLDGAVLLSMRGGDFVLTVGQDLSIGYVTHDRDKVELYLAGTFTFRVLDPAAAVCIRHDE